MLGTYLERELVAQGNPVSVLSRKPHRVNEFHWDPAKAELDARALAGIDWVVHLAGEPIGASRWTKAMKERILQSRIQGTGLLAQRLAAMTRKPQVLVCASGSNRYGPGGPWDEDGPQGNSFLARVVEQWEAAAQPARDAGIRVVHARMSAVLSPHGGMLKAMLPTFRLGIGGWLGDGSQRVSWIHAADAAAAIAHMLNDSTIVGPVNVTAPRHVTNAAFARTLASVLHRPAIVPVPGFAVRLMLGEVANELALQDNAIIPAKLTERGFHWRYPELHDALVDLLAQA